jgi:hypothetical protein
MAAVSRSDLQPLAISKLDDAKLLLRRRRFEVRQILDTVTDKRVLDLPQIRLEAPEYRTVQAVRSLIDVKGISDVRMRHNLGEHGVCIEDTLIYRTAA